MEVAELVMMRDVAAGECNDARRAAKVMKRARMWKRSKFMREQSSRIGIRYDGYEQSNVYCIIGY